MSQPTILFLLRLISATLLLAFLGAILWFLYRDLRSARLMAAGQTNTFGALRVLANTAPIPALDSLVELSPVTSIGRSSRNTIVLNDSYVSGEHALLTWRDMQWWLEDLGSRNGTLLNDVAITDAVVLSLGDVITIGGIKFKLELPGILDKESGIRDSNP